MLIGWYVHSDFLVPALGLLGIPKSDGVYVCVCVYARARMRAQIPWLDFTQIY